MAIYRSQVASIPGAGAVDVTVNEETNTLKLKALAEDGPPPCDSCRDVRTDPYAIK